MEHVSTYLRQLKFDPRLLGTFVAGYLANLRLVLLITLAIIGFGLYAYMNLPRTLNPSINIPLVLVNTVLPGAGPSDVESLITIPLEDEIRGIKGVKTVASNSQDSVSSISVEFENGIDPEKAKSDVQSAVDTVTDLPEDATDPIVQKLDFENQPIWVFNLAGNEDRASLSRFAKDLSQKLEDLDSIDKVEITGLDEKEIQILLKPTTISSFGANPQQVMGAIKTSLASFPAGTVKTAQSSLSFTIDPQSVTIDDLRQIRMNLNDSVVKLSDVATVQEISKPEQAHSYLLTPEKHILPSVSFYVFRLSTVNIDRAGDDAKELVDEEVLKQNGRFKTYTVTDAAEEITESFNELQRDITITVGLVFLVLLLFLGIRQALVALLAAPLTFLITFIVMQMTGIPMSFIATFSLLLALGLLVDDTIVVISAMTAYFRSGKFTPLETGLLVFRDFWIAVLTTTITTVWAFLPLLLSTGIIGEFIKAIPIVVSSTLIASIGVALFITMPFMIFLLKPALPGRVQILMRILLLAVVLGLFYLILPTSSIVLVELLVILLFVFIIYQIRATIITLWTTRFGRFHLGDRMQGRMHQLIDTGFINFYRIEGGYNRLIHRILISKSARRNTIIMVAIFSLFSYLLLPARLISYEFFPKTDQNYLYVSVELPAGTNLEITGSEGLKLLEHLKDTPEVNFVTLEQGRGFSSMGGVGGAGSNQFLYSIALKDKEERRESSSDIAQDLRNEFANYSTGKISVVEESGGPPAGADLQIKLFGPDLTVLDQQANQIQDYLKSQPGVTNIDKTIKPGTSKLVFIPEHAKLAQQGLTLDTLGFWTRLYASGFKADTIKLDQDSSDDQDITVRLGSGTAQIADISSINIPRNDGGSVPLLLLGKLELRTNPTLITREDGKRTLSVTAGVTKGYSPQTLNQDLEKFADGLTLPTGYGWATGGLNEENQNSINSILMAMLLSFLLIIITMVLQFGSFRRALIVMLVIPLSISGVFIVFALAQIPLSFPALIGILALFGIVVKNSILIVDKILINQRAGMEFTESVADAAASRLEPIALTSICAIVGLIPITISDPLWRGLGGAIIAGLTFSGTIMLFFIPVVYYIIYHPSRDDNRSSKKL